MLSPRKAGSRKISSLVLRDGANSPTPLANRVSSPKRASVAFGVAPAGGTSGLFVTDPRHRQNTVDISELASTLYMLLQPFLDEIEALFSAAATRHQGLGVANSDFLRILLAYLFKDPVKSIPLSPLFATRVMCEENLETLFDRMDGDGRGLIKWDLFNCFIRESHGRLRGTDGKVRGAQTALKHRRAKGQWNPSKVIPDELLMPPGPITSSTRDASTDRLYALSAKNVLTVMDTSEHMAPLAVSANFTRSSTANTKVGKSSGNSSQAERICPFSSSKMINIRGVPKAVSPIGDHGDFAIRLDRTTGKEGNSLALYDRNFELKGTTPSSLQETCLHWSAPSKRLVAGTAFGSIYLYKVDQSSGATAAPERSSSNQLLGKRAKMRTPSVKFGMSPVSLGASYQEGSQLSFSPDSSVTLAPLQTKSTFSEYQQPAPTSSVHPLEDPGPFTLIKGSAIQAHRGPILGIYTSALRNHILSAGSQDGALTLSDISTAQVLQSVPRAHRNGVISFDYDPGNHIIMSAGGDDTCPLVWQGSLPSHLPPIVLTDTTQPHEHFVCSVKCNADRFQLASLDVKGLLKIWDIRTYKCFYSLAPLHSVADQKTADWTQIVLPSPNILTTSSSIRLSCFQSAGTGKDLEATIADVTPIQHMIVSKSNHTAGANDTPTTEDSRLLTIAEGNLKIWDIHTGKLTTALDSVLEDGSAPSFEASMNMSGLGSTLGPDRTGSINNPFRQSGRDQGVDGFTPTRKRSGGGGLSPTSHSKKSFALPADLGPRSGSGIPPPNTLGSTGGAPGMLEIFPSSPANAISSGAAVPTKSDLGDHLPLRVDVDVGEERDGDGGGRRLEEVSPSRASPSRGQGETHVTPSSTTKARLLRHKQQIQQFPPQQQQGDPMEWSGSSTTNQPPARDHQPGTTDRKPFLQFLPPPTPQSKTDPLEKTTMENTDPTSNIGAVALDGVHGRRLFVGNKSGRVTVYNAANALRTLTYQPHKFSATVTFIAYLESSTLNFGSFNSPSNASSSAKQKLAEAAAAGDPLSQHVISIATDNSITIATLPKVTDPKGVPVSIFTVHDTAVASARQLPFVKNQFSFCTMKGEIHVWDTSFFNPKEGFSSVGNYDLMPSLRSKIAPDTFTSFPRLPGIVCLSDGVDLSLVVLSLRVKRLLWWPTAQGGAPQRIDFLEEDKYLVVLEAETGCVSVVYLEEVISTLGYCRDNQMPYPDTMLHPPTLTTFRPFQHIPVAPTPTPVSNISLSAFPNVTPANKSLSTPESRGGSRGKAKPGSRGNMAPAPAQTITSYSCYPEAKLIVAASPENECVVFSIFGATMGQLNCVAPGKDWKVSFGVHDDPNSNRLTKRMKTKAIQKDASLLPQVTSAQKCVEMQGLILKQTQCNNKCVGSMLPQSLAPINPRVSECQEDSETTRNEDSPLPEALSPKGGKNRKESVKDRKDRLKRMISGMSAPPAIFRSTASFSISKKSPRSREGSPMRKMKNYATDLQETDRIAKKHPPPLPSAVQTINKASKLAKHFEQRGSVNDRLFKMRELLPVEERPKEVSLRPHAGTGSTSHPVKRLIDEEKTVWSVDYPPPLEPESMLQLTRMANSTFNPSPGQVQAQFMMAQSRYTKSNPQLLKCSGPSTIQGSQPALAKGRPGQISGQTYNPEFKMQGIAARTPSPTLMRNKDKYKPSGGAVSRSFTPGL